MLKLIPSCLFGVLSRTIVGSSSKPQAPSTPPRPVTVGLTTSRWSVVTPSASSSSEPPRITN